MLKMNHSYIFSILGQILNNSGMKLKFSLSNWSFNLSHPPNFNTNHLFSYPGVFYWVPRKCFICQKIAPCWKSLLDCNQINITRGYYTKANNKFTLDSRNITCLQVLKIWNTEYVHWKCTLVYYSVISYM